MIGQLDVALLPETSGMELSADGNRLYLINDGTRATLYVAELDGTILQAVAVNGFRPRDLEDLALGPCADGTCLYFADIGDNARRRTTVQIARIVEEDVFGDSVQVQHNVIARYPDGPHDAESIAIHPATGDLLLATKPPLGRGELTQLYRLTAAQLTASDEQVFEHVGEIPASVFAAGIGLPNLATAMDISPDGSRLAMLTYATATEFRIDAATALPVLDELTEGDSFQSITTAMLIQAESIAYGADGRSLTYTTESIRGSAAPLARNVCTDADPGQL
jgi:hypothetical protein